MLLQKLFRYLMFIWILLLLFLAFALYTNMDLADNKNNKLELSLFDIFFNAEKTQVDFLLQEKLRNDDNIKEILVPIKQNPKEKAISNADVETAKIENEWQDIPAEKNFANAEVQDIKIEETATNVDIILTYTGELGGYMQQPIFSKTDKNHNIGSFVDLYGTWNQIGKYFNNQNINDNAIYKRIQIYTHENYLRITLEKPKEANTEILKIKVQKNNENKLRISFSY